MDDNKNQIKQNNKKSIGVNQEIYRNNSRLTNSNSYMVYELNNTFKDKDKDVLYKD